MSTPRRHPRRWTDELVLTEIRAVAVRVGHTPTSGDMGAALANAARKRFGGLGAATSSLGLAPNHQGHPPVALRCPAEDVPAKPVHVPDPMVAHELELHLERMRKQYAAQPPQPRIHLDRSRRGDFHGRVRWDRSDDYLPPDDLTYSHRRVR